MSWYWSSWLQREKKAFFFIFIINFIVYNQELNTTEEWLPSTSENLAFSKRWVSIETKKNPSGSPLHICWDAQFHHKAIGSNSNLVGATISKLWIILIRYVKGVRISLTVNKAGFGTTILH